MARNQTQRIKKIYTYIYTLNVYIDPKRGSTKWEQSILELMQIPLKGVIKKRGKWLCWSAPSRGKVKINVDGLVNLARELVVELFAAAQALFSGVFARHYEREI